MKFKINITTRLSVADDPIFRMIGGYLTDSGALGKIHLAPEQNKPARLGLVQIERGQFSLSNDHINLKIQCKMLSEYRPQNTVED